MVVPPSRVGKIRRFAGLLEQSMLIGTYIPLKRVLGVASRLCSQFATASAQLSPVTPAVPAEIRSPECSQER
jgi:hypothetical protein